MIFEVPQQLWRAGRRVAMTLLGLSASGCAQDVVLGEHITHASTVPLPVTSDSSTSSTEAAATNDMSREPPPSFTRDDHWHAIEPDGGRSFERDGGPRWPPRPGDMPPILEPGPDPDRTDPDFPFEPPDGDSSFDPSSNF